MLEDRLCPLFAKIPKKVEELAEKLEGYDLVTEI
jgi:hypothetical protein